MGVHPAGVLPNGNALLLPSADARALHARKTAGLGALAALDDALLLSVFDRFTRDDDGAKDARGARVDEQSVSRVRDARGSLEEFDAERVRGEV